ncbi:unnamed protein product [Caenorhabditis angaria]|uniref:Uncharacterized protein n=1 Tax=Caenorhabditis angaria TaxID=860376 RepID=A0A9P1IRV3_9PELO|nr:unnamed protein product [Caenorhabditis angaria]
MSNVDELTKMASDGQLPEKHTRLQRTSYSNCTEKKQPCHSCCIDRSSKSCKKESGRMSFNIHSNGRKAEKPTRKRSFRVF